MKRQAAGQLRLAFECDVADATVLWDAAASRAAQDFAMTPDDVIDTIGPREDPEVEACVAMLFDSLVRLSGAFDSIRMTALRPTTEINSTPSAMAAAMVVRPSAIAHLAPLQITHAA